MDKSSQEIATVSTEAVHTARKRKFTATQRITHLATLVALSLAFKLIGQVFTFGGFKFTLVYIPWLISAVVLGPLGGLTVCLGTDLIGTFLLPTGGLPLPLIALSNALFGLIAGLVYAIPKLGPKIKTLIAAAIIIPVCTLGISTLALALFYNIPYIVMLADRLSQALMVAVNAAMVALMFPLLRKMNLIA